MNIEVMRANAREAAAEARERRQIIRDCIGALYDAIQHEDQHVFVGALGVRQRRHLLNPTVIVTEWLEQLEDVLSEEEEA